MENKKRYEWVDFLKGFGAILVVIAHFWPYAINLYNKSINSFDTIFSKIVLGYVDIGKIGVGLFFIISGYLTANVFKNKTILQFIKDRMHRLYPVYWLSILLSLLLIGPSTIKVILINLTMFQQFVGVPNIIGAFWTLQIDIIFYSIIIMLFLIRKFNDKKVINGTFLFLNIMAIIMSIGKYCLNKNFPVAIGLLLSLTFIGLMIKRNEEKKEYNIFIAIICFIVTCVVSSLFAYSDKMVNLNISLRYIISYMIALLIFFMSKKFIKKKNFLCYLGKISYSIYLLHATIGYFVMQKLLQYFSINMYLNIIISTFVTVLFSMLCNEYVENIWLKFYKKRENNNEKILFINGRFLTQKITGVQRYALEVLKQFDNMNLSRKIIVLCPNTDLFNVPKLKKIKIMKIGKLKGHAWEQISLPLYVKRNYNSDLLSMCNLAPIIFPGYVVIHDISFKTHPEHLNKKFALWYRFVTKMNIRRYKHIFTVSNFSKSEILSEYGIKSEKITITYNSAEHIKKVNPDKNIIRKLHLENTKFIFSLGSASPHKNRKFIVECAKNNPNYIFVITGNSNKVFVDEKCCNLKNVIFTGYLNDSEIISLYKSCEAFLFPSLYEGFGIPPLEAIECGCKKIILSNIDVLKEIYGNNLHYIDAEKPKLFNPKKYKSKKINIKFFQKYKWSNVASLIIKVIGG